MQYQPSAKQLRSLISRRMQATFVFGLVLGILIGWVFSGLVSAVMRFGLAVVLLVPLVLAIWFWWKVRNAKPEDGATVVTWSSGNLPASEDDIFAQIRRDQSQLDDVVIDLDDIRREPKP